MNRIRRGARLTRGVAAASVAGCLVLAGCSEPGDAERPEVSSNWDEVVAAAEEEGSVQLYFSIGQDVIDHLNAGFKEAYPDIDVQVYRSTGGSGTLIERMENDLAADAWIADVVLLSHPQWLADARERDIVETELTLPSSDSWDEQYWKDGTVALVPTVLCVAYNTELVDQDELPTSWEDMADPRWADRMAVFEPRPNTDSHTNLYQMYIEKYGEDFIADVMALQPRMWGDANSLAEGVGAGESAIGAGFTHKVESLKKSGAPIDFVMLEPAPTFMNTSFVPKQAPHPNAARVFLNYAMSEEGQEAIAGNHQGNSLLDVPGAIPNPDEMYVPDIEETAANYDRIMELLGRG